MDHKDQLTALAILVRAKALLQKGWTRDFGAVNHLGNPVEIGSPSAVAWDIEGAVDVACAEHGVGLWMMWPVAGAIRALVTEALDDALAEDAEAGCDRRLDPNDRPYVRTLDDWNDAEERTQEDVLRLLDAAIDTMARG